MKKNVFILSLLLLLFLGVVSVSAEVGNRLSRENWQIMVSSACDDTRGGQAAAAIDDDPMTYWHSNWGGYNTSGGIATGNFAANPEYLILNLGSVQTIGGIGYVPRYSGDYASIEGNGALKGYKIYVAGAEGFGETIKTPATNDEKAAVLSLGDPLLSGELTWSNGKEHIFVTPAAVQAQYIMIVWTSSYGDPANKFANCSDLYVYEYTADFKPSLIAKLAEFQAMVNAAGEANDNPGYYSSPTITAAGNAIRAAQAVVNNTASSDSEEEAALATLVTAMADFQVNPIVTGTYKIVSAYSGFEEKQGVKKAIYANDSGTEFAWKSVDDNDKTFYWNIEVGADGKATVTNAATGTFIQGVANSKGVLSDTPQDINFNWVARGEYNINAGGGNFHANNHSSGNGSGSNIIIFGSGAGGASAWTLIPATVSAEVNLSWEKRLLRKKLHGYQTSWAALANADKGVIASDGQLSANSMQVGEGSLANLLDNDYNTYFHSGWSSGPDADHYLQVESPEAIGDFMFYFYKRNNDNRPTTIVVTGSENGTDWNDITTINSGLPVDANVPDYLSATLSGGTYKHIRFTVTETNTGGKSGGTDYEFFTFSEFRLIQVPVSGSVRVVADAIGTTNAALASDNIDEVIAAKTVLDNANAAITGDKIIVIEERLVELRDALAHVTEGSIGTVPGCYEQGVVAAANIAVTNAETLLESASPTDEEKTRVLAEMETALANLHPIPLTTGIYKIVSAYSGFTGTKAIYSDGADGRWKNLDDSHPVFYWNVTVTGENITIQSVAYDNLYLTYTSEDNKTHLVSDAVNFKTTALSPGQFNIKRDGYVLHADDFGNDTEGKVSHWAGGADSYSAWTFVPVATLPQFTEKEVTLVYKATIDGAAREVARTAVSTRVGLYLSGEETLPVFTRFAANSGRQLVTSETAELTYNVEQDVPFAISESFETAVWQKVQMHTNQTLRHWQYDGEGSVSVPEVTTFGDKHLWAFVGNILDGFKIYNRAAGESYTLNKPGNGGVETNMSTDDSYNRFVPAKSDVTDATPPAVCFKLKGDNIYLNTQSGKITTYSAADAGSSCRISKVESAVTLNYVVSQYGNEIGRIPVTVNSYVGEVIDVNRNLPTFTHSHDHHEYTVGWEENPVYEFNVDEDVPFAVSQSVENLFYQRVRMNENDDSFWQYSGDANATEGAVKIVAKNETEDRQLWAFVGNIFDGFKIYNKVAGTGMTLRKAENGNVVSKMSSTDDRNLFMVHKNQWNTPAFVCFKIDGDTDYLAKQGTEIKGSNSAALGSSCDFYLIDINATLVYTLNVNGATRTLETKNVALKIGDIISANINNSLPAFTQPADDTEHLVTPSQTTYTFPVVQDLPFQVSENFENARWHNVLMHTSHSTYYWQYNADAAQATENVSVPNTHSLEDKHLWAFVGNLIDGFKIYNKAAGASMTLTKPEFTRAVRSYMAEGDVNNAFKLHVSRSTPDAACFKLDGDDNYLNAQDRVNEVWEIKGWYDNDQGSSCKFFYKPTVDVTRILVDESDTEITRTVETSIRNIGDVMTVSVPEFSKTEDPTTFEVTEESTSVTITLTQMALPFIVSENYENAVWQIVRINGHHNFCWTYDEGDTFVSLVLNDSPRDHQLWAVTGNVLDGFKFYNRGTGPGKTLRKAENGETVCTMSAEDSRNAFFLSTTDQVNFEHVTLKLDDDDSYLNAHHYEDQGGRFLYRLAGYQNKDKNCAVEFFSPLAALNAYAEDRLQVHDELYYRVRDIVGFPHTLISRRDEIIEKYGAIQGYDFDLAKLTDFRAFVDGVEAADNNKPVFDPANKRYRMVCRNKDLDGKTMTMAIKDNTAVAVEEFALTPQSVITFEPAGTEGQYHIQMQGWYLMPTTTTSAYDNIKVTENKEEAGIYSVGQPDGMPSFYFLLKDEEQTGESVYLSTQFGGVMNWRESTGDDYAHWYIVEADTVSINLGKVGDYAYSSACYSFPVKMPDGVRAFVGNGMADDETLNLQETAVVAAGSGFLLSSAEAGVKKLVISKEDDETAGVSTVLKGTCLSKHVDSESDVYIFGKKTIDGVVNVGFYWLPQGTLDIPANKAYLERGSGSPAIKLKFPDVTGIDAVDAERGEGNGLIYDLSGRVVGSPVKGGVYIKNGKKFILK